MNLNNFLITSDFNHNYKNPLFEINTAYLPVLVSHVAWYRLSLHVYNCPLSHGEHVPGSVHSRFNWQTVTQSKQEIDTHYHNHGGITRSYEELNSLVF